MNSVPHKRRQRTARMFALAAFCLLAAFISAGCERAASGVIGVDQVEPDELLSFLNADEPPVVLDVRSEGAFREGHIPGAIRVDPAEAGAYLENAGVPKSRPVVTVCRSGRSSLVAAAFAMGHGYRRVGSLADGMTRWIGLGYPVLAGAGETLNREMLKPPTLEVSRASQVAMTVAACFVKPLYTLLSFLIVVVLWRKTSPGLVLIRRACALFFLGENACMINFVTVGGTSELLDLFHGLGMVGMNALLPWGLALLFDEHVFHYLSPEKPCMFQRFCRTCWKKDDAACGFHRLLVYLTPALAAVALAPLTVPLRPFRVVMPILYSDVLWPKEFLPLFAEFRVYPVLAAVLLLIAFVLLLKGRTRQRAAMAPFFVGLGFATFSIFRLCLTVTFQENPAWDDWWEEFTELIAVAAVALFLIEFREPLGIRLPWFRSATRPGRAVDAEAESS